MEKQNTVKKAWCDMDRQYRAITLIDLQLLSHTAPTSLFQVFTREQASKRKWCAYMGIKILFYFSYGT